MKKFFSAALIPGTLLVCPRCPITSIQKAISQAKPGSTIQVQGGYYSETPLVIDKPLHLIGEDHPVIDAQGKGNVILVSQAPGFQIKGFEIKNAGISYTEELAGIRVLESNDCVIQDNLLLNNTFGIFLQKTENCQIKRNTLEGGGKSDSDSGDGIHIWYGGGHTIQNNTISKHRDGIYFEFVKDTLISQNQVHHQFRYGLHFMSSNHDIYEDNRFSENGAGVAVMYSRDIEMRRNHFSLNTGPANYGLLLKEIHSSTIEKNTFDQNTTAIFMEGSNRSRFLHNLLDFNGIALKIMADCEANEFRRNDFTRNSFDVTTNGTQSNNHFEENFWSHYEGYDLNRDERGDQPFRPVSLSSIILERVDSSYIFLNSFLFRTLDQVERALPTLIPEALKDEHPSMHRISEVRNSHD